MENKIYNYNTHSLNCSNNYESVYSLTINFLELLFDYKTNELIDIYGFFPLVNAIKCNIDLPEWKNAKFYINISNNIQIKEKNIYNYGDVIVDKRRYLTDAIIKFDEKKGIICIGDASILKTDDVIKINKNIICIANIDNILKCIYIIPDAFVK